MKMLVPTTSNSSATRQKPEKRRPGRESAEGKKSRSKPREQSQPKNVLYDTDTASLDDTSTIVSEEQTRHASRGQEHARQSSTAHPPRPQHEAVTSSDFVDAARDDAGEELLDDPLQNRFNPQNSFDQMLAQANAQPSTHRITDTYIKGDSYPPTTSGNPSVSDGRVRAESEVSSRPHPPPVQPTKPLAFTVRGGVGKRQQLPQRGANAGRQQNGVQAPQEQMVARTKKSQPPARAASPQSEAFEHEGSENFSFAPQPQARKMAAPVQQNFHNMYAPLHKDESTEAMANNSTARPVQHMASRPAIAIRRGHQVQQDDHVGQVVRPTTNVRAAVDGAEIGQDSQYFHGPADPRSNMNGGVQMQYEGEESDNEEDHLDYPYDEIVNMSYDTLKKEPFDKAPGAQPFVFDNLLESADISEQMAAAFALRDGQPQADFFASLGIDDWEAAGDWFLDRFGGIISKLRETRIERREAARQFEREIEQRDIAINKKRKLTDAALDEMKSSGAAVLAGTPKRSKKTK